MVQMLKQKKDPLMRFFVRFANKYENFQVTELKYLMKQRELNSKITHVGRDELFCIIEVSSINTIDFILERAIFVKSVSFYDFLYFDEFIRCFKVDKRNLKIRLSVTTIDTQMNIEKRTDTIEKNMKYIKDYPIDLADPDYIYQIFAIDEDTYNTIYYKDSERKKKLKFDVKERPFIGITCMDWEISIFMANVCAINKSTFVLEPFIGSAGIALACMFFDSQVIGIEYDVKMLYGQKNVRETSKQV